MLLFLDANIYLSFYTFTKDDLEDLRKLEVLLRQKTVTLLLPRQVEDEFKRNRDSRIGDSLRRIRESGVKLELPQLTAAYPESERLKSIQREFKTLQQKMVADIQRDAHERELDADKIISGLRTYARRIPEDTGLLDRARLRVEKGNPPGKRGSLGDALNWEALLSTAESGEELHLVSADRDYASAIDESRINPYLLDEWQLEKWAEVKLYRSLADFTAEHVPEVRLAADLEKKLLIRRLSASDSFRETHRVIRELNRYTDFSPEDRTELLRATSSNNQVYMIMEDDDVRSFTERLLIGNEDTLDPALLEVVWELLEEARRVDDQEPPSA